MYELSPIEDYNIYKDYLPLYTTVSLNVYKNIILELPLFDCIIIINSVVAVALYKERIYIYMLVLLSNPFQYFSE